MIRVNNIKMVIAMPIMIIITLNCSNLKNDKFKSYLSYYGTGCDTCEVEGFKYVDLSKYKSYYKTDKNNKVNFKRYIKIKNIYLVEYGEAVSNNSKQINSYITYFSSGNIVDVKNVIIEERGVISKYSSFSERDNLLKVYSFDSIKRDTLKHMFTPNDWVNANIEIYNILEGKFNLIESRNVKKTDWSIE